MQFEPTLEPQDRQIHPILLSIVTPAYNEASNLPVLYERLKNLFAPLNVSWEWIVVDDHSSDQTFAAVADLARRDRNVRGIRFAHNFGAHKAVSCGIRHARGDCAVVMAADLQDPPEVLPALLEKWKAGAQVVWAVREHREGESLSALGFSRLYYGMMRHFVGLQQLPATGADFFLVDRRVMEALSQFTETNISLFALITWMGFRQESIEYTKERRLHGKSGWSLEKKCKLVVDSITSFTYLPIRLMSYVGFVVALLGFSYAGIVVRNFLLSRPAEGWSSLMVVVLVIGGIQMLMMGVLGEYLWRALDESRRRPPYLIEDCTMAEGVVGQTAMTLPQDKPVMHDKVLEVPMGSG